MVIVQLNGGLGNQMFQYAVGRALAEHLSTVLKLDLSLFETCSLRRYGLHCFHIWENIATQQEIVAIKGETYRRRERLALRIGRRLGFSGILRQFTHQGRIVREESAAFEPRILEATGNLYLVGYWQSERYFSEIRETLLREFTVKYEPDDQNRALAEKIKHTNAVSLHVRRGDYAQNPKTKQVHGVCDLVYYEQCVEYIAERIGVPHFYLFSDDPAWVRENVRFSYPMDIVDWNSENSDFEDLRLMSQCHHHIIANSSFSWWGAWLGNSPEKIVIAPQKWFNDTTLDTKDLIPATWIRL